MPISTTNTRGAGYQPFECYICHGRFTRHENLKRHATLHSRSPEEASLPCEFCNATFSRHDLKRRHMKRKHPEQEIARTTKRHGEMVATKRSRAGSRRSQESCAPLPIPDQQGLQSQQWADEVEEDINGIQGSDSRYLLDNSIRRSDAESTSLLTNAIARRENPSGPRPTQQPSLSDSAYVLTMDAGNLECSLLGDVSMLDQSYDFGVQLHPTTSLSASVTTTSTNLYQCGSNESSPTTFEYQEDWFPSASQVARGIQLYFKYISHFVQFLHRPTFDQSQVPSHLILGMLCLGYQHGEDPDCSDEEGSGATLSRHCFRRARVLLGSREESTEDVAYNTTLVQTYLLIQICAMMYLCGRYSAYGLSMHSKMISLARSGGLMQPISIDPAATEHLDSLWLESIKAESRKRTVYAVHQLDALYYQLYSTPRLLSHLEIKHDLPCPAESWNASSAAEWAHRQLVTGHSAPSVQYIEAVRLFLSPDPKLNSLPAFDPYGAINIAQFLISSAREISGWSTMTGRLSMERFEPLKLSLEALRPFMHGQADTAKSPHVALLEATWEIAMIELQIWSPTHTDGVIEGSIDGVLKQSTHLAPRCEFLLEPEAGKAIQPHVDWFLRYLDLTIATDFEPPWITLYAYKAFLIVWQLVRGGLPGAMRIVDIQDGDLEGAMAWARKVFQRRKRWEIGRLIMSSLDILADILSIER